MCPCYLLNPGSNGTAESPSQQGQGQQGQGQGQVQQQPINAGYAPYGIIGYVPVVFVPYCPGNNNHMQSAQQNFPNAVPVPYNCAQCQANSNVYRRLNGARSSNFGDLKEIKSLNELEDLLKKQIKPMKRSLHQIAVHPKVLDDENDKSSD